MKQIIGLTFLLATILFSCKKDKEILTTPSFIKDKISGLSQKGPLLNGSSLTLFELDNNFSQTGKSFNTQILDNSGSFEIYNLNMTSQFAKLKADGFYFNEVTNENSLAPISLYALSDLSNKSSVNVNLLTTLEATRMGYLLSNGSTFANAKTQAQTEVLNIFLINKTGIPESELLDISKNGDDNAILLAASLILQGYRTEAELTQLLGDISTDIRTDGILNSPTIGTSLINDAKLLNLQSIRSNIESKYISLGITTVISNFEKYVKQFTDSSTFTFTKNIQYPQTGIYGLNILYGTENISIPASISATSSNPGSYYDLSAFLPLGTSLKINIQLNNGQAWGINSMLNWDFTQWNNIDQTFTAIESGKSCNLRLDLFSNSTFTIKYYENNSITPTKTKQITVY